MANIDNLYAKWLNGELSAEEEEALKKSGEWAELEAIIKATDELALPELDLDKAYATQKAGREKLQKKPVGIRPLYWVAAAVAAALALFFLIPALMQSSAKTITAAHQKTKVYRLPDGSEIKLNDGSTISFVENEYGKERIIELMGEAFFDVKKGGQFIVKTQQGDIEVLGTTFNVMAWDEQLIVDCFTGKVQVNTPDAQQHILNPSEKVVYKTGSKSLKSSSDKLSPRWLAGISQFENADLEYVFNEMERQYNVDIKLNATGKFSGLFTHNDIEVALNKVCKPLGLQHNYQNGNSVITVTQ